MRTSKLQGAALDWAVAKCEYETGRIKMPAFAQKQATRVLVYHDGGHPQAGGIWFSPSTNWAQGGPIIEREKICTSTDERGGWMAWIYDGLEMTYIEHGPTQLIAAMRCYVASKLGDEVEIPEV